MGDIGDYWRESRQHGKNVKRTRLATAGRVFRKLKVNYSVFTESHWRIFYEGREIDFWPTTSSWRVSDENETQYGLKKLLDMLGFN